MANLSVYLAKNINNRLVILRITRYQRPTGKYRNITSLSFSTSPWYNQPGVMLMQLTFEGIAVGAASLLIIGAFHPLVIWCEYHFTQRVWPVFLAAGLLCLCGALFVQGIISIVL